MKPCRSGLNEPSGWRVFVFTSRRLIVVVVRSPGAIPAALAASTSRCADALFSFSASAAVGPCVATPIVRRAMSGATVAVAVPSAVMCGMSSRLGAASSSCARAGAASRAEMAMEQAARAGRMRRKGVVLRSISPR